MHHLHNRGAAEAYNDLGLETWGRKGTPCIISSNKSKTFLDTFHACFQISMHNPPHTPPQSPLGAAPTLKPYPASFAQGPMSLLYLGDFKFAYLQTHLLKEKER